MQVFCDFDGTISLSDTTDVILSRFAAPQWELIEEEWKRGDIGSAECMRRQIALIHVERDILDATLDSLPIDPSFPAFVRYCETIGAPITILSDGLDYFIKRILARHHLSHLPVIANHLHIGVDGIYSMSCPHSNPACNAGAGVCKCAIISQAPLSLFVGDGRSDFCAADSADLLFAKSTLATYCVQRGIAYTPYHRFSDIERHMKQLFPLRRQAQAATIHAVI